MESPLLNAEAAPAQRDSALGRFTRLLTPLAATALCLAAALVALAMLGYAPGDVSTVIVRKVFGRRAALAEILQYSTPILLTGLAVAVAFRASVWNIGAQGQLLAGALASLFVGSSRYGDRPAFSVMMALSAAMAAGALAAGLAAALDWLRKVPVVLSTLLLNFIIIQFMKYLINGPLADGDPNRRGQSMQIRTDTGLPLFGGHFQSGIFLALAAALIVAFVINYSTFGFRLRIVGQNAMAARFAGIHVSRVAMATLAFSGALAGLAGGIEVCGVRHMLYLSDADSGYGFTGIAVALLGRLSASGVVASALFFGILQCAFLALQSELGVSAVTGQAVQGLIVIVMLIAMNASQRASKV